MNNKKQRFRHAVHLLAFLLILGALCIHPADGKAASANLLTNPGAEAGSLSGWTMKPGGDGKWINANNSSGSIPAPRTGTWLFFPGVTAGDELYQDVNISAYTSGTLTLSGWMRDYTDGHGDVSSLRLEIRNSSGQVLSSKTSGEVTRTAVWVQKSVSLTIPGGASVARVVLVAKRNQGSDCDSYFDDLSLTHQAASTSTSTTTTSQSTGTKHPIGYTFKDSYGRVFKVINDKTMKVSLTKVPDVFEKMFVAETATAPDGTVYRITAVAGKAAANCTHLETVWFSKNLTRISQEAFKGCKKLSAVYFFNKKLDTKYLDITGFYNIKKNAKIYVYSSKKNTVKKFFAKNKKTKSFKVKAVPSSLKKYLGNAW